MNTGNFESLRVDAGIETYVRDGEKVSDAQERVYQAVEKELLKRVEQAHRELKGISTQ